MLTVKTNIKYSDIGGLGLFAGQNINKGQIVWKNNTDSEMVIKLETFNGMSDYLKSIFYRYGYKMIGENEWRLPLDDSRFMNHSYTPSISENENGDYIAISNIKTGEEITCNYREFDDGCGDFKF